jgi:hypothetical protein
MIRFSTVLVQYFGGESTVYGSQHHDVHAMAIWAAGYILKGIECVWTCPN